MSFHILLINWLNNSLSAISDSFCAINHNFQTNDVINYPNGFNKDNCVITSVMGYFPTLGWVDCFNTGSSGSNLIQLILNDSGIKCNARFVDNNFTNFKVVLQKIS